MDPFVIVIVGGVGILFGMMVLLGLMAPGSGTAQLDWRSPQELAEIEAERDSDDLAQMLEATNARRRARGERELTLRDLRAGGAGFED